MPLLASGISWLRWQETRSAGQSEPQNVHSVAYHPSFGQRPLPNTVNPLPNLELTWRNDSWKQHKRNLPDQYVLVERFQLVPHRSDLCGLPRIVWTFHSFHHRDFLRYYPTHWPSNKKYKCTLKLLQSLLEVNISTECCLWGNSTLLSNNSLLRELAQMGYKTDPTVWTAGPAVVPPGTWRLMLLLLHHCPFKMSNYCTFCPRFSSQLH